MVSLALINTLRYRVFHFDEWNTVKKGVLVLLNAHSFSQSRLGEGFPPTMAVRHWN